MSGTSSASGAFLKPFGSAKAPAPAPTSTTPAATRSGGSFGSSGGAFGSRIPRQHGTGAAAKSTAMSRFRRNAARTAVQRHAKSEREYRARLAQKVEELNEQLTAALAAVEQHADKLDQVEEDLDRHHMVNVRLSQENSELRIQVHNLKAGGFFRRGKPVCSK